MSLTVISLFPSSLSGDDSCSAGPKLTPSPDSALNSGNSSSSGGRASKDDERAINMRKVSGMRRSGQTIKYLVDQLGMVESRYALISSYQMPVCIVGLCKGSMNGLRMLVKCVLEACF